MLSWFVACVGTIGLSLGCSTSPNSAAPPPEQTAVVSKEQAKAIIARANMNDAGPSPSDQKERAGNPSIESLPKKPIPYREGLKKIARELGEGQ
jgi:hypothetical protein